MIYEHGYCKLSVTNELTVVKARMAFSLVVLFCFVAQARGQGTLNITFDGPPIVPVGSAQLTQRYDEGGMSFTPISSTDFVRSGGGDPRDPDNGTAFLQAGLGSTLMFSFTNGSVFSLAAVDLAEYSTVVPSSVTVHFVGYRPDGSVIMADVTTDGVIDGIGPLPDFQTFNLPGFTGLSRVEIPTFGWSLDNLVVSVPEPSTLALLLLGGLLIAFRSFSSNWRC